MLIYNVTKVGTKKKSATAALQIFLYFYAMHIFHLIVLFLILPFSTHAQLTICSWNVQRISANTNALKTEIIAQSLKQCDVIGLQEITITPAAKNKLQVIRKRLTVIQPAKNWQMANSTITNSNNAQEQERYTYIYDAKKVKLIKHYLATSLASKIVREPYIGIFKYKQQIFTVYNYHAVPKSKQPQKEIETIIKTLSSIQTPLIWMGDFNCYPTDTVFNILNTKKFQYAPVKQATTIKQKKCDGNNCYANAYDYFWMNTKVKLLSSGHYSFLSLFNNDGVEARKISDHIPVYIKISF